MDLAVHEVRLAGELLANGPEALLAVFGGVEQAECPVHHHFGPGVYIRECHMPAGTLVVGEEHTSESMNVMLKGRMVLLVAGKASIVEAPFMTVSPPGRKAAYVLEDTVWQNIFATDETDLAKLEAMFIAPRRAIA